MKKVWALILACALLLSVTGCGAQQEEKAEATAEPAAQSETTDSADKEQDEQAEPAEDAGEDKAEGESHEPVSVSLATADVGSLNYGYGAIFCDLITEKSDWLTFTAQASAGMGENIRLVGNGEADFGMTSTTGTYEGLTGTGAYDGETPYENLRAVCVLFNGYNLMLARDGIDSWEDLVGCTVGLGAAGSNTATYATAVLQGYGIYDQVDCVNLSYDDCVQLMVDGEMDAYMGGTAPFASTVNLAAQMDIHALPIREDLFDEIAKYAKSFRYDVPATAYGNYDWLTEDVTTIGFSTYLVVDESVPDDVVYEILRVMMDENNQDYLKEQVPSWEISEAAARIEDSSAIAASGLKLHSGAVKFWEDYGLTIPDDIK